MDITTTGSLEWPLPLVWSVVADFAGLEAWHPLIEGCEADGSRVGALRTVFFTDRTVVERLDELDEASHCLTYRVVESTRPATLGLTARITLSEHEDRSTFIEWVTSVPAAAEHLGADLAAYYPQRLQHLAGAVQRRFARDGQIDSQARSRGRAGSVDLPDPV